MNLLEELEEFIKNAKDARELKRAMAVKMSLQSKSYSEIEELLKVSSSFISKWKSEVLFKGVESLKLQYKGGKGYLNQGQKEEVITWLQEQNNWSIDLLSDHLKNSYDIVFQSPQSYYTLLKEAKISWKKTQKKNPVKDDKLVEEKKQEIQEKLEDLRPKIEAVSFAVFMIDECHLLCC